MPSLFLPTRNALVTKSLEATTSMWAWMRDITAQFNGGNGFAPADATYFLRTADTDLPNARVATNSATITLDYTTPGQVKWNATSSSAVLATSLFTLTDAQVKALPTTPFDLVAAQGANTLIIPVQMELVADFTAGAYTNVNADSWLYGVLSAGETGATGYIPNDSSIPRTDLSTFLGANHTHVSLNANQDVEIVNAWGTIGFVNAITAASFNSAFQLKINNSGSGDLTGGNAANTLKVIVYYAVQAF